MHLLTAISHPTRRAIIGRLAMGPARFLDVAAPFDIALNAVTKHLKLLEKAGLIERKKQGREVVISFRGEPLREVAGWLHEYERYWTKKSGPGRKRHPEDIDEFFGNAERNSRG